MGRGRVTCEDSGEVQVDSQARPRHAGLTLFRSPVPHDNSSRAGEVRGHGSSTVQSHRTYAHAWQEHKQPSM